MAETRPRHALHVILDIEDQSARQVWSTASTQFISMLSSLQDTKSSHALSFCICADGAPGKTHRSPFELPAETSFVATALQQQRSSSVIRKMEELTARPPKKALKAAGLGYTLRTCLAEIAELKLHENLGGNFPARIVAVVYDDADRLAQALKPGLDNPATAIKLLRCNISSGMDVTHAASTSSSTTTTSNSTSTSAAAATSVAADSATLDDLSSAAAAAAAEALVDSLLLSATLDGPLSAMSALEDFAGNADAPSSVGVGAVTTMISSAAGSADATYASEPSPSQSATLPTVCDPAEQNMIEMSPVDVQSPSSVSSAFTYLMSLLDKLDEPALQIQLKGIGDSPPLQCDAKQHILDPDRTFHTSLAKAMRMLPQDASGGVSIPQLKRLEMYTADATQKNPTIFSVTGTIEAHDMCRSAFVGPQLEITASTFHGLGFEELFDSSDRAMALDAELHGQQKMLMLVRETEMKDAAHLGPIKAHFVLIPSGQGKLLLSQIATHELLRPRTPPATDVSAEARERMQANLQKIPTIASFNPTELSSNVLPHLVAKSSKSSRSSSSSGSQRKITSDFVGSSSNGGGSSSTTQRNGGGSSSTTQRKSKTSSRRSASSSSSSSSSSGGSSCASGGSGQKKRPSTSKPASLGNKRSKGTKPKPISSPATSASTSASSRTPSPLGQHVAMAAQPGRAAQMGSLQFLNMRD